MLFFNMRIHAQKSSTIRFLCKIWYFCTIPRQLAHSISQPDFSFFRWALPSSNWCGIRPPYERPKMSFEKGKFDQLTTNRQSAIVPRQFPDPLNPAPLRPDHLIPRSPFIFAFCSLIFDLNPRPSFMIFMFFMVKSRLSSACKLQIIRENRTRCVKNANLASFDVAKSVFFSIVKSFREGFGGEKSGMFRQQKFFSAEGFGAGRHRNSFRARQAPNHSKGRKPCRNSRLLSRRVPFVSVRGKNKIRENQCQSVSKNKPCRPVLRSLRAEGSVAKKNLHEQKFPIQKANSWYNFQYNLNNRKKLKDDYE